VSCIGEPDAPKSVVTKSRSPTAVVIVVEPPEDDGGMPVLGYRVDYNDINNDFSGSKTFFIIIINHSTIPRTGGGGRDYRPSE
jgi:hypothetical protein